MWIIKKGTGYAVRWYDAEGKRRQKDFRTKAEAKKYGSVLELTPKKAASTVTVRILMEKYIETVTPTKRGQREETLRIRRMERYAFADKTLSQITTKDIQGYLTERSQERTARSGSGFVSPSTVTKERITLSAIFSWAVKQGFIDSNPVHGTDTPPKTDARTRVASDEEVEMILAAAGWDGTSMPATKVQLVAAAFVFACRTGMRSGEILQLEESWIDGRVIHLPKEATKTGAKRDVALSSDALRVLELVKERGDRPQIFGELSAVQKDVLWRRIRDRAGLGPVYDSAGRLVKEGLNFHDSRATFATWAASPDPATGAPRLDVLALARQTGHKDLKMLQRYYRASAEQIADRLG